MYKNELEDSILDFITEELPELSDTELEDLASRLAARLATEFDIPDEEEDEISFD